MKLFAVSRYLWGCLAGSLCVAPGCGETPVPVNVEQAATLPEGVSRLDGMEPTLAVDDLAAFGDLVGDAPFVALGESVHTSEGYSRMKYRLIRYLVEHKGYRAFGIESPWVDADLVAHYVDTCEGDPKEAMKEGLFRVWGSQSALEMVMWMCEYNRAHPSDPVHFYGFDVQQPWSDGAGLAKLVPADVMTHVASCDGVSAASADDYYGSRPKDYVVPDADYRSCLDGIAKVRAYLTAHPELGSSVLDWAEVHLVGLESWEGEAYYMSRDFMASYEPRDIGMAKVAQEIRRLRFPGAKTILWAHNAHIALDYGNAVSEIAFVNMGTHLAKALGEDYASIGLVGYTVEINWPGVGDGALDTPLPSSLETALHGLGEDFLLADTKSPLFPPGGVFHFNSKYEQIVPAEQFRALVYLEHSPPMDALFW